MKSFSMLSVATAIAFVALNGSALAAGDAAAGEKVFAKCKACHQVGETAKNAIAPELNGLDGRKAGSVESYHYSDAMKDSGITWNEASFQEFIKNPKAKVPGTKMVFQGLSSDKDEADVWAYLSQFGADGKKK
ncbi:c-type cytochrome [Methylocystis bryophila]|uniref:Cytochrome c family protein n=1 Tax=Methylocystis bryophila TaxID=655015 RepID=A0A1W6MRE3_9HYPH|nr:cytochrome c family protein [Methylocystis bryophila]ARN80106.1 cytochrome c family protein [Methylocystis bryophila]BDV40039.1 cytochrome c-550 [Methylocystis bryophila]